MQDSNAPEAKQTETLYLLEISPAQNRKERVSKKIPIQIQKARCVLTLKFDRELCQPTIIIASSPCYVTHGDWTHLFVLSFLTWRKSQWMAITCQEVWGN
jgi:hypothetical protein